MKYKHIVVYSEIRERYDGNKQPKDYLWWRNNNQVITSNE